MLAYTETYAGYAHLFWLLFVAPVSPHNKNPEATEKF
jgi:hypothetical protein